jgi:oxygen-dependent protoporphyrinogen oxidase
MTPTSGVRSTVIGGGIAGLVAARELAKRGDSVTLLEATGKLGGLISGVELMGVLVDSGAEAFAVSRPQTLDLIEALGLSDFVVRPTRSDARIRVAGKTVAIPNGILGIPASLSDTTLLESVGAEAVEAAKILDGASWAEWESPTIGELVLARLGKPFLDKLVAPVIGGVHASDPMKLELRVVAPGLLEAAAEAGSLVAGVAALRSRAAAPGAAVAGFIGGMHLLVEKLAEDLTLRGVEIRLNSPVTAVRANRESFEVVVPGSAALLSSRLVIAVPPHVASEILTSHPSLAGALAEIEAVDVAIVALAIENTNLATQPLGSGVLVTEGERGISAKASTHSTAKWQWLKDKFPSQIDVIRVSYGRDGVIPVAHSDLVSTALSDVETLYGLEGSNLVAAESVVWSKSLIQSRPGHQDLLRRIQAQVSKMPGLAIVGAALGGNGITGIIAKTLETISQIGVR